MIELKKGEIIMNDKEDVLTTKEKEELKNQWKEIFDENISKLIQKAFVSSVYRPTDTFEIRMATDMTLYISERFSYEQVDEEIKILDFIFYKEQDFWDEAYEIYCDDDTEEEKMDFDEWILEEDCDIEGRRYEEALKNFEEVLEDEYFLCSCRNYLNS